MNKYKFDIAFSFLDRDESLAVKINDALKTKVKTFIYLEHQKRLGGADGEVIFRNVFIHEARVIAILYREEWGIKGWTKIESDAIRERGREIGFDTVVLISLEDSPAPKWYPKYKIWTGYARHGFDGLITILESRIEEFEGIIQEETIIDKVARLENEKAATAAREKRLESNGYVIETNELNDLKDEIEVYTARVKNSLPEYHFFIAKSKELHTNIVLSKGYSIAFEYIRRYSNSIQDSVLNVYLFKGYINIDVISYSDRRQLSKSTYELAINNLDVVGWKNINSKGEFYTTKQLVNNWCDKLLNTGLEKNKY